ncbi:unnamed protein product [Chironomus riparius]|uniref:Uncharacterized protein n=1 Tax=Chironomus riparius TaxID=315576 RepID=A0A9N9S340_9DIPT|nr:unnamed protein product [Chironomus riparius]
MAKINVNSYIVILLVLSHQACTQFQPRQMPSPDISALKDDNEALKDSDEYLPAVMMALHYYTELMQYEIVQNVQTTTKKPVTPQRTSIPTQKTTQLPPTTTTTTQKPTTTTTTTQKPTTTTTTTQKPTTTTKKPTTKLTTTTQRTTISTTRPPTRPTTKPTTSKPVIQYQTHRPHKPGVHAPERPPYYTYFNLPLKPEQSYHRPGIQQQAHAGITTINQPDWKNPEFFTWFFQKKPKDDDEVDENELRYLDVLPKKLLLDIQRDTKRRPALLDYDNVVEFRKIYDDSYNYPYKVREPNSEQMKMNIKIQMHQQKQMLTGKKKPPPTRPYVLMLMLYDVLKREAKTKKLHQFKGFSDEFLRKLDSISHSTSVYQMKYLLEKMLENKEVSTPDVVARSNVIVEDLKKEKSDTYKTLVLLPPLPFNP